MVFFLTVLRRGVVIRRSRLASRGMHFPGSGQTHVDSGTLTGRALELFHKSILVRSVRRSSVLFLVTDVHKRAAARSCHSQKSSGLEGNAFPGQRADTRRYQNPVC
jgi:hypothetical protein